MWTGKRKTKVGGIRYKARSRGRSSPDTLDFWACEREPTTAWTAVSSPSRSTRYAFFTRVEWGARYGRTVVRARPNEHSQRIGPPSSVDSFPCLREKPDATSEFRSRDLSIPSPTLCRCARLGAMGRFLNPGYRKTWDKKLCQLTHERADGWMCQPMRMKKAAFQSTRSR